LQYPRKVIIGDTKNKRQSSHPSTAQAEQQSRRLNINIPLHNALTLAVILGSPASLRGATTQRVRSSGGSITTLRGSISGRSELQGTEAVMSSILGFFAAVVHVFAIKDAEGG